MSGETFAQLLRHHRLSAGLSQNQLAREAGIDPAYVNRLEREKPSPGMTRVNQPTRTVVLALAEALELTASQTDRFLFAAGLATHEDWQTRAVRAETALASIRQAIDDAEATNVATSPSPVPLRARTG